MSLKSTHEIIERDIGSLRPYPGNARTHSKKQIAQIARSIERFSLLPNAFGSLSDQEFDAGARG